MFNLKLPWQKKTISASSEVLRELLSAGTSKSGANVTHATALQATTALACASVIAEGIAQVPLKVFQERQDGGADPKRDHPLYDVLHLKPNEYQTAYEWREMCGLHLAFTGDAFSYIVRDEGRVVELLPFDPGNVTVVKEGHSLSYKVAMENGETMPVAAEDMLHLRGRSWNGYEGLDGIKVARDAIGLSMATEEHGSKLFQNGAQPGGILTSDLTTMSKDQREALRDAWNEQHAGSANAHKTAVVWGGLKWLTSAQQNDQAQFLETRIFQVEEVCRAFRVLPIMVGHSDKAATYASSEQMFLAHLTHTLNPWFARLEQAFDTQLLTDEERQAGMYTKHVTAGLMRSTHEARASFYNTLYNIGAISPNEIRALEEMNPYDGGGEYRVPLNMEAPGSQPEDGDDDEQTSP